MEGQIASGLRLNSQNSALFRVKELSSACYAESFVVLRRTETGILTDSDPTDHALATIASILDHPESHREGNKPALAEKAAAPVETDGYSKTGPGPMAAIRFKWTVRRADDGQYYVDETIGEHSSPIVNGPMAREAAIRFVDDREDEARQKFEELRSEMTGRAVAVEMFRKSGGEV
jgi:hypothetical protein